jgi:D-xylose transport system substrate-binding protein
MKEGSKMHLGNKTLMATLAVALATGIAACGGSGSTTKTTNTPSGGSVKTPTVSISLSQLSSSNFSAMKVLKPIAAAGTGEIAAILPDTTSSERWAEFDAPDLKAAMAAAGIPASDISVQNALGSDTTFLTEAKAAISKGAKVLLTTPEDAPTGIAVEKYAAQHGVKVIDYDRLTLGGSRPYYVSFNNVTVGTLIGKGFVSCVKAWNVAKPQVIVMHGSTTDNNATLFYNGYNAVLSPLFKSGAYTNVLGNGKYTAGTWDPPTALTEFKGAFTAHPTANAMVNPNDETAAPIITYLIQQGVKPYTFPATGQDATPPALQAIVAGYQCGTVYKPIGLEAQAAVALAVYLRAGFDPPKSLVNGVTADTTEQKNVPSALLAPEWVTAANMKSTVVKDKFVPVKDICVGSFNGKVNLASACAKDKI